MSDEFVDVILGKLVEALRPGLYDQLEEATLNAALAIIDSMHPQIHWLRLVAAEHVFELPQQRSSFLELWCVVDTPYVPTTAHPAEIETQKAEVSPGISPL